MVKISREKRQAIAAKRRRRSNGQFAEEPDILKPKKGKRKVTKAALAEAASALGALRSKKAPRQISAKSLEDAKAMLSGLSDVRATTRKATLDDIAKELTRVAPKLTTAQKARLLKASATKVTPPAKPAVPSTKGTKGQLGSVVDPKKTLQEDIVKLKADKIVKRERISIQGDKLEIWRGTSYERYDPSFKQRRDRNFEYAVDVDGERVVLNRQWNVFTYKGETVKGMPSLHPDLARMTPEDLTRALVASMSQAQQSSPNAPKWDPGLHGQVDSIKWTYDLGSKNGGKREGYYGEMQIHHIGQWARTDLKTLQDDYKAGRFSPDEYKRLYEDTVYTETYYDKSKGKDVSRLAIKVQDQADRAFVALPAGLHDTNSSLFRANHHPYIHDPDTGKQKLVGIPNKGKDADSGSREWFNSQWKGGFWKQVYQREAYVLRGELQRRLNKGELSGKDLEAMLDKVYGQIAS